MAEEIYQNESFDVDRHPDALYDNLMAIHDPFGDSPADHFWERFYEVQNRPEAFDQSEVEALAEMGEGLLNTDRVSERHVECIRSDYLP